MAGIRALLATLQFIITQYSDLYMALGTQYNFVFTGQNGVSCFQTIEVLNAYGGGAAQGTLNSGYCNTDGFVPGEGSAQAVDVGYGTGPVVSLTSFGNTFTSFEPGANIFYGVFYFCSQDPPGQQNVYACVYLNGGPLF